MCILFLYVNSTPPNSDVPYYKLVLAFNRDEAFARPTAPANFWASDDNLLAGRDLQDGGTWLGVSKTGKIGALLNVRSKPTEPKKKSRGDIVTGLLRTGREERGLTYCNTLHQDPGLNIRNSYGLFNLITVDLIKPMACVERRTENAGSYLEVTYFTNATENAPKILNTDGGRHIFGFGNSVYDSPFCKVTQGCQQFKGIMEPYETASVSQENTLNIVQKALEFLKSEERHYPDAEMDAQSERVGIPKERVLEASAIFVKMPSVNYGTRTHTIIIVDSTNLVTYHEWTLKMPVTETPEWIKSEFSFHV